jgi:hypothetical protein
MGEMAVCGGAQRNPGTVSVSDGRPRRPFLFFNAILGFAMCFQRFLVRPGRVFECLPRKFVGGLMILLVVMIGRLPVGMRSKIMHLSGDLMGIFHGQSITG